MSLPPPTSKIGSPPVMLVESGEGSPTVVLVPSSPGTAVVDEVLPTLVVSRSGVLVLASAVCIASGPAVGAQASARARPQRRCGVFSSVAGTSPS